MMCIDTHLIKHWYRLVIWLDFFFQKCIIFEYFVFKTSLPGEHSPTSPTGGASLSLFLSWPILLMFKKKVDLFFSTHVFSLLFILFYYVTGVMQMNHHIHSWLFMACMLLHLSILVVWRLQKREDKSDIRTHTNTPILIRNIKQSGPLSRRLYIWIITHLIVIQFI